MVTKSVNYRGSALADRLGTINNFICNDENNLLFNPIEGSGTQQGVAENRFRVAESIAPMWSKVSVGYKKTAIYGSHDGTIEVYGMDNLGIERLLYQTKIDLTESGLQNRTFIDMLKSSCTGAVTKLDNENVLRNDIEIRMPKLRENYDDISLQAAWLDPAWTKRKGVPINLALNAKHVQTIWTKDTGKDSVWSVPAAYQDDFWYQTIKVTYDSDMKSDFSDLRFTGFDGISPIEHWIITKTDSSTATVMLRIPWYWGWNELERPQQYTNFGVYSGTSETPEQLKYSNTDPKYLWMYYGNATCTSGSKTPKAGEDGIYYFDDFTSDTTSEWTKVGADSSKSHFEWDGSSSLDMQIDANTVENGFYIHHELPDEISGTYASFDIIWKLENIPTTSGNYDAAVWIGSDMVNSDHPNNLIGLWINASDVFAVQSDNGTFTTWTSGSLSFNHDDTKPLYIRARVHPDHEAYGNAGVEWEISKDCRKWTQVVNLLYPGDISVLPYKEFTHFGMRMSSLATAPTFNMELDTDWIMITESHHMPSRGIEFTDHFDFSDLNQQWGGYNYDGTDYWSLDSANSQAKMTITSGSHIYTYGNDTAARLEIPSLNGFRSYVMETKLDAHTLSSGNMSLATMYAGTDKNKHFNICHQLYSASTQFDQEIRCWSTMGGVDTVLSEQNYQKEPIAEGPIWMRIIYDKATTRIIGQYSRDGFNWYNAGSYTWESYSDLTDLGFVLQNGGNGVSTASWDYFMTTMEPYAANHGNAFTAEQSYSDFSDIAPKSAIYYEYNDDFEDGLSTGRTYPYRNYVYQGGGSASLITNTLGSELLVDNQGQFETGVSGLTAGNCTITQSNTVAQSGTYSAKMVATAQDSYGAPGGDYADGTFRLGLAANTTIYLEGYVYPTSANQLGDTSFNRATRAVLFYKDASGAVREVQSNSALKINEWNKIQMRAHIPIGATAAALRLYNGVSGTTCYWDNISMKKGMKPISGTYSLRHESSSGTDSTTNVMTFEQPVKEYTATFKWNPVYDGYGTVGSPYYRLWMLRSAGDPDSFTCIDLIPSGSTIIARIVSYHNRAGNVISSATYRAAAAYIPQNEHDITVIDSGTNATLIIDDIVILDNVSYGSGTNVSKTLPGTHSGFGSNGKYCAALWDNINIKPGYWYKNIQYTDPSLDIVATKSAGDWQTFADPKDSYYFDLPSTYIRNQPMKVAWKDQGQPDAWQYSKPFYPRDGGVFYCGPNGLDKYIGMKTKIIFEGDSEDYFEITDITYEYEV